MDERELFRKWEERQEVLKTALGRHPDLEYRLNLEAGELLWIDRDEVPRVKADCKVLCTWSPGGGTVLMGWANESLEPGMYVGPYQTIPDHAHDCEEADAWYYAMCAAEEAGAQALYRCPGPAVIFLGLWGLRDADPNEVFVPPSATPDVLRVLDGLSQSLWQRRPDLRQELQIRGAELMDQAQFAYRGAAAEEMLLETGGALVALAETMGPGLSAGEVQRVGSALADLRRAWSESSHSGAGTGDLGPLS